MGGYRVVAFEPQATEVRMLSAAAAANGLTSAFEVFHGVASNKTGRLPVIQAELTESPSRLRHASQKEPVWVGMMVKPEALPDAQTLGLQAVSSGGTVPSLRVDDTPHEWLGESRALTLLKI